MVHLPGTERLYISEDLIGFADKLTNDGVFPRRLDLLPLGFSHVVMEGLPPAEEATRRELMRAVSLQDQQLPIEAVAHWYARELGQDAPESEGELWASSAAPESLACALCGSAGKRRGKSQIQWDLIQFA